MPDIDDLLSRLAEGRIFSTMDFSNGFLQIPLSEEAKEKTAFVTEETTARFERMPFEFKEAPGTFQRIMNSLQGTAKPGVDICIFGRYHHSFKRLGRYARRG